MFDELGETLKSIEARLISIDGNIGRLCELTGLAAQKLGEPCRVIEPDPESPEVEVEEVEETEEAEENILAAEIAASKKRVADAEKKKAAAEQKKTAAVAKKEKKIVRNDVFALANALVTAGKKNDARTILQRYATNIKSLTDEQIPEVYRELLVLQKG